jgi:Prephenate dehydrogenase
MNKIHIIGLGLLGGSFGLAARRKFPELTITGFDISEKNLKDAEVLGIITEAKENPDSDTDIILLATPADSLGGILEKH